MDAISPQALDWAIKHINKFSDTDIFPTPFEYEVLNNNWEEIKPKLASINLNDRILRPLKTLIVPKSNKGFRVATQLDPLDSLFYLSLVYECSDSIEKVRTPKKDRIACSYRIELTEDGDFFAQDSGWLDFQEQSKLYCGKYAYVLKLDITDFYNQIYHHRIENELERANIPELRRRNIIRFLSQMTAKTSRGIPVGPTGSILLAEACMNDVDMFIGGKGLKHTRYVDDFRIFCVDESVALRIWHDLTKYLYEAHRLTIHAGKTNIFTSKEFLQSEMQEPEDKENRKKSDKLQELHDFIDSIGYLVDPENLAKAHDFQITEDSFKELFLECFENDNTKIALLKYLLRRARALKMTSILPNVFDNMERLTPCMRDVIKYLMAIYSVMKADERSDASKYLLEFVTNNKYGRLPFVRLWILALFSMYPESIACVDCMKVAESASAELGLRPLAMLAKSYNRIDWIRERKENWRNSARSCQVLAVKFPMA